MGRSLGGKLGVRKKSRNSNALLLPAELLRRIVCYPYIFSRAYSVVGLVFR